MPAPLTLSPTLTLTLSFTPHSHSHSHSSSHPFPSPRQAHEEVDVTYASIAADFPTTVRYLTSEWVWSKLCDAQTDTCGPAVPGTRTVAWLDRGHLSTAGALYLAPFFNCWLDEQGLL